MSGYYYVFKGRITQPNLANIIKMSIWFLDLWLLGQFLVSFDIKTPLVYSEKRIVLK